MQNLLLFQVIGCQFGIRMPLVKNVQNTDKYQPRQSDNILPLTLLVDGKKIPLHDLSIIFSSQSSSIDNFTTKKILLTEDDKGLFAFIIDRIDGVVAVSEDKIGLLPPIFNGPARNCFPEVLKTAGYATAAIGKWHLGHRAGAVGAPPSGVGISRRQT